MQAYRYVSDAISFLTNEETDVQLELSFDISTVAFSVLEVNGNLSVLLKKENQPATPKDLKIESKEEPMFLPVISDGKIIEESLLALETDHKAIEKKLNKNNVTVKNVFLMMSDRNGNYNIIKKR